MRKACCLSKNQRGPNMEACPADTQTSTRRRKNVCAFKCFTFVVVDYPTTYNAILGHPVLVDFGAVTSIRHLCMKFSCDNECVGVRGDQKSVRICYNVSIQIVFMVWEEALIAYKMEIQAEVEAVWEDYEDELDPHVGTKIIIKPMEDVEEVNICDVVPTKTIKV
uniref:Uncharacterized protein n=1 Tax=Cannabis sativa TaxID=3483 RepID=A0A803PCT4_CANSA